MYLAFAVSGVAGLVYEVLWSRYLALYVGHGAYAQVLVLAVYLGGMAVGGIAVADLSRRVARPLAWYAAAEAGLAAFGIAFHLLFVWATDFSYEVLFPAVGGASGVGAVRWSVAALLVLPQAILLGTTFPLMATGLLRADPTRPGGAVAVAYLVNTLGGAVGVLVAGFWALGALGLPGTSFFAAGLNLVAAGLAWRADSSTRADVAPTGPETALGVAESPGTARDAPAAPATATSVPPPVGLLYTVAFGTAVASFAYEIGWIRMLSLVLGSATHAFELMLSAFILGLALGAWAVRRRVDRTADPLRLLGIVQMGMGAAAVASLPVYLATFGAVASMVDAWSGDPAGYALFNVGRYTLCLLVMLPATVLAGTTLPLATGALLRTGGGEEVIGRVYGLNTIGSVLGAAVAGLLGLSFLGLEGLIVAGATLDAALGVWLLAVAERRSGHGVARPLALAAGSALLFAAVVAATPFDPTLLTSGVYRRGDLTARERHESLYYRDGRTATVSAHLGTTDGLIVLATNGKPDASIPSRWLHERRDTLPVRPIARGSDVTTQALAPVVALAHNPDAASVANIGHGSGLSAVSFLTSPRVRRVVTIEIEPLMVEGSMTFLPANAPAFADPRATYVFDDAKSFFSYRGERFDVVFAEPSNPWVSGTASLFTVEFYRRMRRVMSEGAVFAQWMQIYELDDDLFLTVLAALAEVFPHFRVYLVGDADVAIVASADEPLADPDWSVVDAPAFAAFTAGVPPFFAHDLEALRLLDRVTIAPLLAQGIAPNSDFRPRLDLEAERARFDRSAAVGVYSFATSRVDLSRELQSLDHAPAPHTMVPAYGLAPIVLRSRASWLREALGEGGGIAPDESPEWQESLAQLRAFLASTDRAEGPASWTPWTQSFARAEGDLHWGTTGIVADRFYERIDAFLARVEAPDEAHASVALLRALALRDWPTAADASDVLVSAAAVGRLWIPPELLLDVAVVAHLQVGGARLARAAFDVLAPRTGLPASHFRLRLLDAWIARAEAG